MTEDYKKQYNFRIRKSTMEYIYKNFPPYGWSQFFAEHCFEELRRAHEASEIESPVDLVGLTVREVAK